MAADVITGMRVHATTTPVGDVYFLEIESYSKNVSPRTPFWSMQTCGNFEVLVGRAVGIASGCEGGMVQIRGVSGAGPEHFMRRFWRAVKDANRCDDQIDVAVGGIEQWPLSDTENAARTNRFSHVMAEVGVAFERDVARLNLSDAGVASRFIALCDEGIIVRTDRVRSMCTPFVRSEVPVSSVIIPQMPQLYPWRLFADPGRQLDSLALVDNAGKPQSDYSIVDRWYKEHAAATELACPGASFPALVRLRVLCANAPLMPSDTRVDIFAPKADASRFEREEYEKLANGLGVPAGDCITTMIGKVAESDVTMRALRSCKNVQFHLLKYRPEDILSAVKVENAQAKTQREVGPGTEFLFKGTRYRVVQRLRPRSQMWSITPIDGTGGYNCANTKVIRWALGQQQQEQAKAA